MRDRAVDPALLPHPRPCWCSECKATYSKVYLETYTPPEKAYTCSRCSGVFKSLHKRAFCSDDCKNRCETCDRLYSSRRKNCHVCREISFRCIWCSETFTVQAKSRRTKYCSDECFRLARNAQRLTPLQLGECAWCYSPIVARRGKRCCGKECSTKLGLHIKREWTPDRCFLPICVRCKKFYSASYQSRILSGTGMCSSCRRDERIDDERARWKRKNSIRRSKFEEGDRISTRELGDLEDWVCYLCAEPINPDLEHPHPGCATIDHVIPLIPRDGEPAGTHTWDNVRIAHLRCNMSKGNRPLTQAA